MCFAPQRRALFRHRNFQKWSENGVFCTFWLGHVLRATTACTFWTCQLPKALRHWGALYVLTSKRDLRNKRLHFFDISTSKRGPRPPVFNTFDFQMCFSEPTFRPSGATNQCKNAVNHDFATFSRTCIFFLLTLSLLSSSLLLSDSSHLCFSICPYCRKFDI